jgi:hypothetical protein
VNPSEQCKQLAQTFSLFVPAGSVGELRAPKIGKYKQTDSGCFESDHVDDFLDAVKQCAALNPSAIYMTLNPIDPALLARAVNRGKFPANETTSDEDIVRRRWILADFDAKRPAGISSTNTQHEAAIERATGCRDLLLEAHGAATVLGDSGNGGHTLIPVDLPNDPESEALIIGVLAALAARFDDAVIKVDQSVFNASRICKVYGSKVCKGDDTLERPHRYARLLDVPADLPPVPVSVLRAIAGIDTPKPATSPAKPTRGPVARPASTPAALDVAAYVAQHGIAVHNESNGKGDWHHWNLESCPFNTEHQYPDSIIAQNAAGAITFKCLHDSCRENGWHDVRKKFEPGWTPYDPNLHRRHNSHNSLISQTGQLTERMTTPIESPPSPLDEAAYYGLAGEIVRMIQPHTESDPAAILVQMLVAFGNLIGRNAYFPVEATKHYMNLFAVMVGQSAKARKGTSLDHVRRLFEQVDTDWIGDRVKSGLSSGEGMLHAVRDPIYEVVQTKEKGKYTEETQEVLKDAGVDDKRLFITESEFARTLRVMEREGNTLSAFLRDAWDTGKLCVLTKSPQKATNAHISIAGHITRDELRRLLTSTEAANGFANRFLWIYVQRSKLLPRGGELHRENMEPLIERLGQVAVFAQSVERMDRDEATWNAWDTVYPELTRDVPGLLGSVTSRAEAQVTRLACLYALLDNSAIVRMPHLTAALAVWEYAEQSARYIFGDALGDAVADAILQALRSASYGMTRKEISDHFGRHHKAERLTMALHLLQERGLATFTIKETGGRPAEIWQAVIAERTGDTDV